MKALLVIDVQNGFIKEECKDLPKKIREHLLAEDYEHILFSKFVNTKDSNFVKLLDWTKLFGPPETDIVPELAEFARPECVFEKSTYSAFKSAALIAYLQEAGIEQLDMCGIESDGCVLATAYEGFDLGYEVIVLRELMRSTTSLNEATENIIKRNIDRSVK